MGAIHTSGPESSVSPEHQSDAASRAVWDLVIIGAGPAGMACAIYAGRARLRTLVLEKMLAGGQVVLNDIIENYPGFPEGIAGPDLGRLMSEHAARFGAEIQNGTVEAIDCSRKPLAIHLAGTDPEDGPRARSLLIATGCSPRRLGVPGERELYGRGVSYCATCDGPLFAGKPVAVVGGGNTAIDDALFLANIASKVTVVHRRDQLRADPILQERAFANAKIEFGWSRVATAIVGDQAVEAIRTRHVTTGEETDVPVAGVFIAIGETPQVGFVPDHIRRDEGGYIVTDADFQTSAEGVFAAGDVRAGAYRQIAVAIGEGVLAYRSIRDYLEGQS